jgi:hypothetical protein
MELKMNSLVGNSYKINYDTLKRYGFITQFNFVSDTEVDIIYINYGYRLHEEFLLRFKYEIDEFSNFILNPNDVKEIGIFYYSVSPRDQNPIIRIKDDCIIILGEYNYKYDKV